MSVASTSVGTAPDKPPGRERPRRFRLLEIDPELGQGIGSERWQSAVAAATVRVFRHQRGPWRFFPPPDHGALGALVLEGLILVRLELRRRGHLEVLGEGDVICPWVDADPALSLPSVVTSYAACDLRIALLDREFTRRIAAWPEIHAALTRRLVARSRRLALQSAINALPRTDERVELTLWRLALRFGKVTSGGVRFRLRLTHSQLADMVAAQRPSVSVALARLAGAGLLKRRARDEWLLCGPPPVALSALSEQTRLGLPLQDGGGPDGGLAHAEPAASPGQAARQT
jgi:CRP/FNR family cyclic AMP-dependent transcriptional regulator